MFDMISEIKSFFLKEGMAPWKLLILRGFFEKKYHVM
jgi:hypothetical protein